MRKDITSLPLCGGLTLWCFLSIGCQQLKKRRVNSVVWGSTTNVFSLAIIEPFFTVDDGAGGFVKESRQDGGQRASAYFTDAGAVC